MRKVLVTALQLALLASAASGWSLANPCQCRLLFSVDGAQVEKKTCNFLREWRQRND